MSNKHPKKLLIIGAGLFQKKAITEANSLGYYTIAVDGNINSEGKFVSDEFFNIDVTNKHAILDLAKTKEISGVISVACEPCITSVSFIAERLGLVGNKYETALLCHDKLKYFKLLSEKNIQVPKTIVYNSNQIIKTSSDFLVVKPSKGSGSRGVKKYPTKSFQNNFDFADYSKKYLNYQEKLLIQEYIEGIEITVDCFVFNNKTYLLAISEEISDPDIGETVSRELIFPPYWLTYNKMKGIKNICENIVGFTGITFGPVHYEFKITKNDELFLIDFSLRGGGFGVFTDIIKLTSGIDILPLYIKSSMGETIQLDQPKKFNYVILSFIYSQVKGRIKKIFGKSLVGEHRNYILKLTKDEGDLVELPDSGRSRVGYFIIWGDRKSVKDIKEYLNSEISFVVDDDEYNTTGGEINEK